MTDYIVTVMARDRVGIVRDVSSALAGLQGNITHLSQTVVRGYFTLIISCEMPPERTDLEIREAVDRHGNPGEFEVGVRRYESPPAREARDIQRFTLSMSGRDRKGIIATATTYLCARDINIDDFYSIVHDGVLLMLAQVSIPAEVDAEQIRTELTRVGEEFGLVVNLRHENIFKVTSDVRPISALARGGAR